MKCPFNQVIPAAVSGTSLHQYIQSVRLGCSVLFWDISQKILLGSWPVIFGQLASLRKTKFPSPCLDSWIISYESSNESIRSDFFVIIFFHLAIWINAEWPPFSRLRFRSPWRVLRGSFWYSLCNHKLDHCLVIFPSLHESGPPIFICTSNMFKFLERKELYISIHCT